MANHEIDLCVIGGNSAGLVAAAIVGLNAGELIHEYVLALSRNLKVGDLANAIHIYPILAQINRRVANLQLESKLTPKAKRWIKLLFGLRGA